MNAPEVETLVSDLGATVVVAARGDLAARIASSVIADPSHPVDILPGTLVLAVGFEPGTTGFAALVNRVGSVGGAGVVVDRHDTRDQPAAGGSGRPLAHSRSQGFHAVSPIDPT